MKTKNIIQGCTDELSEFLLQGFRSEILVSKTAFQHCFWDTLESVSIVLPLEVSQFNCIPTLKSYQNSCLEIKVTFVVVQYRFGVRDVKLQMSFGTVEGY